MQRPWPLLLPLLLPLVACARPPLAVEAPVLSPVRAPLAGGAWPGSVAALAPREHPHPLGAQESAPSPESESPEQVAARLREAYAGGPETWPAPTLDEGVPHRELALVPGDERPKGPQRSAREELGKLLFFDARLSGTGQMACIHCHDPEIGFGDGRATSYGRDGRLLRRNAPSLLNTGLRQRWFWDGRAASLEEQALSVLTSPDEMDTTPERLLAQLSGSRGYRQRFAAAFGDEQVTLERALSALADFQRTFRSDGSSKFDAFLRGDSAALSDGALRGLHLFRTEARCLNCHNGPLFSDEGFHDLGLSYYGREREDLGRYQVTSDPADVGRFRTPSLRNLSRSGPYMHNGLFELEGILNMYEAGMVTLKRKPEQQDDPLFPTKSPHLQPLELSDQDKADLLEFLRSLTERKRRLSPPELPALGDL